jgi:hypothetical protein
MSKRFIDTELFNDPWFMDLSVNSKLLFVYMITNCDHAGIIDMNWKLVEFQTKIKQLTKSYDTLIKELGNRIIRLRNDYYFIPKFISFQYPGFPKSNVRQQDGAIKRLKEFDLWDDENLTLNKELINSYGNGTGNGTGNDSGSEEGNIKGGEIEINYPWDDNRFIQVWDFWKKYKKEQHGDIYKSIGEQAQLTHLYNLSNRVLIL